MQTAVDRNGSNGNSNSTITTTTTLLEPPNSAELLSLDVSAPGGAIRSTPPMILAPGTMLEQSNVLRHRLQVGVGRVTSTATFTCTAPTAVHRNGSTHPLIDVTEYLGSNVERMSLTPSPSPQASPSRRVHATASTIAATAASGLPTTSPALGTVAATATLLTTTDMHGHVGSTNSSLSSSTSSSSNSTTSSVIASPVLRRNANANTNTFVQDIRDVDCDDGGVGLGSATQNSDTTHEISGLPLPPKSATFSTFHFTANEVAIDAQVTPLSSSSSNSLSPASLSTASTTTNTSTTSLNSSSSASTPTMDYAPIKPLKTTTAMPLLHWQDMPTYLQFNPYVLNGYRPLQPFKGCLLSLFYWHNETVNILTHAIPIIYILAIVPGLMPWEQEYRFLSFCHLFGSVAPWCGSFVYHLFMNIERGENLYYTLLKLDMVGIWVSQSFGALPLVTATTFCFSSKWKWFIIISYCLLSLWGLYKALTASSPWQRRLCFALPFTMRSILTLLRTMGLVGGSKIALSHVYLQDGVSILGGAIGAMRIPEKWFPGLVDFYLNSHNIMHVLVVVAVYSMHKATIKDFEWMSATNCDDLRNATGKAIENTFTSNVEL